ncbi:MAG: histidine ammonia-lyase [Chlorobi bacterium]|nr:histidine ammonia-lyase [Chlorobiota bacterium]MCI0717221.1 histidine ammonia-lyase [Chlorobiota bacterium]
MKKFLLNGSNLTVKLTKEIVGNHAKIGITPSAKANIIRSRNVIEKWLKSGEVIYGVTTGFGEFKDVRIPMKDVETLQKNLIISHSAGVGEPLPKNIVRLMLLLRINSLAKGYSGVRLELVEQLIKIFNLGIVPFIPSQGSVGSSGDLAPLAHLASFIIGEGYAYYNDKVLPSKQILSKYKLKPVKLSAKEGLALINGTQMMTAYAVEILNRAYRLSKLADISGAMSVEALKGSDNAIKDELQKARPHKGQINTAANLRKLLKNSEIRMSHIDCGKVQDAYSLRCIPQVHGAVKDTIEYVSKVIEIEINSATDNPLIFPKTSEHIEGGNFHGEPIALAMDFLKIALSELGNISERRTARLVDGSLSGLPRFLTSKGGLNSGLMIAQYTAASLVSENKILSHPASVDSIPTSANQEDHNSLGSIAARNCFEVLNNVEKIIAVEMLCSCQGIDFLKPLKCGIGTNLAYRNIRKAVKHIADDVMISGCIQSVCDVIYNDNFLRNVEAKSGRLF